DARMIFARVLLGDQNLVFGAIPAARPVLVGPAQREGQVERTIRQECVERTLQQALSREPIIVEAERGDAILAREIDLAPERIGRSQIVEAELTRQPRLMMPDELRYGFGDVGPLG